METDLVRPTREALGCPAATYPGRRSGTTKEPFPSHLTAPGALVLLAEGLGWFISLRGRPGATPSVRRSGLPLGGDERMTTIIDELATINENAAQVQDVWGRGGADEAGFAALRRLCQSRTSA